MSTILTGADAIAASKDDYVARPADMVGVNASLEILVKDIGARLMKEYQGWQWMIQPDPEGGVITLRSRRLGMTYGMIFLIEDVQEDPSIKVAMNMAGELIERFGCKRGHFTWDTKLTLDLRTGVDGEPKPDFTDKDKKLRSQHLNAELDRGMRNGNAQLDVKDVPNEDGTATRHIAIGLKGTEEESDGSHS